MLRLLTPADSQLIQPVFDACGDYAVAQDGRRFAANAAELAFDELPPGFSKESKRIYAIEHPEGQIVGLVEGVRGYPISTLWFIGRMLIVPEARSTGIGTRAVAAIERYVESMEACSEIELAVLKINVRGLHFWTAQGFCHRRDAAAEHFGQRLHERWILGKSLRAASSQQR